METLKQGRIPERVESYTSSSSSCGPDDSMSTQMTPNSQEEVKRGFDKLVEDSQMRAGKSINKSDF
jgi:hypothetical protein